MTWKARIKRGEKLGLELSPAERKLLLTGLVFLHQDVELAIRSTPPGGEVMLTLSDLEDLVGHVAGEANHAKNVRTENILSDIFDKIEGLLDLYVEEGPTGGFIPAESERQVAQDPPLRPRMDPAQPDGRQPADLDAGGQRLITDIRLCLREAQVVAFEKRLIPYIPADRADDPAEE